MGRWCASSGVGAGLRLGGDGVSGASTSAYSPADDLEETAEDDENTRQSKRARYSKGESGSASSPTKQSNPEVDDMGSSSPSAKEQIGRAHV